MAVVSFDLFFIPTFVNTRPEVKRTDVGSCEVGAIIVTVVPLGNNKINCCAV